MPFAFPTLSRTGSLGIDVSEGKVSIPSPPFSISPIGGSMPSPTFPTDPLFADFTQASFDLEGAKVPPASRPSTNKGETASQVEAPTSDPSLAPLLTAKGSHSL